MIIRKPLLNFDVVQHLFLENNEEYIKELLSNNTVMEAILLNSEDLYKTLKKTNNRIDSKTKLTLLKYLLRMCGRPQPFGLSAGVCTEKIEKNEQKLVDLSKEWKVNVIKSLRIQLLESKKVKIMVNPFLLHKDVEFTLMIKKRDKYIYNYLKSSNLVSRLLELLKHPNSIENIVQELDIKESVLIEQLLKPLIENRLIIIETPVSVINDNSERFFEFIYDKLSSQREIVENMMEIQNLMEKYQNCQLGEGIDSYLMLKELMSNFCTSSKYLTIDLYFKKGEGNIKNTLPNNFESVLKIMNLFPRSSKYDWASYNKRFIDKYGLYNKVPLLQTIDIYEGIGLPIVDAKDDFSKVIFNFTINKILNMHYENDRLITLTEEDFDYLKANNGKSEKQPISYDCKFTHYNDKILFPPNAFNFPRYSFTSRFKKLNRVFLEKEKKFAEIAYFPSIMKDVGQSYHSEALYYIDAIGSMNSSKKRIALNEINLFSDGNKICLCYKNSSIVPIATHLLNYSNLNEHPAILFLFEYSIGHYSYPNDFPIYLFDFLEYIPRIEFKNLIISPARINIRFKKNDTDTNRQKTILDMLSKYKFNKYKYVYIVEGDRTIPVPTNNSFGLKFIENNKQDLGDTYKLTLVEAPELDLLKKGEKNYDYIYSSSINDRHYNEDNESLLNLEINKNSTNLNYSSFELYYKPGKRIKLEYILLEIMKKYQLDGFFIVNYLDKQNRKHIRVRYKKDFIKDAKVERDLNKLISSNEIYDYNKTIFLSEISRYGGERIYKKVLEFFSEDTKLIYYFKDKYQIYQENEQALYLTSYLTLFFFKDDFENLYDYIDKIQIDKIILKNFSKQRSHFCSVILRIIDDDIQEIDPNLKKYNILAKEIYEALRESETVSKAQSYYIIKSIIHMTINRHFPFMNNLENEANNLMRFSLYNLKYEFRRRNLIE